MASKKSGWMRLAASLAIFAAGGIAGWLAHGDRAAPEPASFAANAMGAHRIFVAERRHPVEVPSSQQAHLFKWLSKRLGVTLKAPDLSSAGFSLMGGRLLADGPMPAAQFMYENAAKTRMTVYVRAAGMAATTPNSVSRTITARPPSTGSMPNMPMPWLPRCKGRRCWISPTASPGS